MSTAGCGGQRYPEFQMAPGLGHPAFCLGLPSGSVEFPGNSWQLVVDCFPMFAL